MTTDRDQSIERLLRQARPGDPAPPADACPDAETLAALADDTLPAALRREVEGHIADCYHCQALTAAIARAEAPVGASAEAAGDMPAWRRRALNWFVPAAAAATAVALWVLVPGQNTPPPTEPISERQVAEAPPPALPAPSSEVVTSEPLQIPDDTRADEQTRDRNAALEAGLARSAPPPAAPPAAAAPPPPVAATPAEPLLKAESPVVGGVAPTPEVSASAPVSAAGAADQGRAAAAERRNEGALNETVAVQQEQALNRQLRAVSIFEVVSPNARIRWRVGPGPTVQYSANGGGTWATQQAGATVELTAGSSPAAEVCWLVGRGGLVLRTTNAGRQWQRILFPETVDLRAITASTARNATVVLADGRQFATGDGGMTWNPVR
jgi:photosynthesis system II assembly factor YCF48-like protein